MNEVQKLEATITYFRQMLADEQLKTAQLTVLLQEKNQQIGEIEKELTERVQEKGGPAATGYSTE